MKYLIAIVALCLALVGTNATASDEQQLSHYAQPQGAIVIERAPVVRLFGGALRTAAWPFTPKYYYLSACPKCGQVHPQ